MGFAEQCGIALNTKVCISETSSTSKVDQLVQGYIFVARVILVLFK